MVDNTTAQASALTALAPFFGALAANQNAPAPGGSYQGVDANGVQHITIGGVPQKSLTEQLTTLFGPDAAKTVWGNDTPSAADTSNPDTNAQGDNVVSGATDLKGIFTQEWWQAHMWDVVGILIVLVLIALGLYIAVPKPSK